MRPYLPKRPPLALLGGPGVPRLPVADNTFLINDFIAPFVEAPKDESYAHPTVQDYGLAANMISPDSKITACYWEPQSRVIYYGTDRGEVFRFAFDNQKEERVKPASSTHEESSPIAKLYVTKKNWVWYLQNKRMERFDMGLLQSGNKGPRVPQEPLEQQSIEEIEESHICFCQEDKFIYRQIDNNRYCKIFIDDDKNELIDTQTRIPEDSEPQTQPKDPSKPDQLDLNKFELSVDGTPR